MTHPSGTIDITESGRGGTVRYREGDRSVEMWWEFGGGDSVADIHVGTVAEWAAKHPWAASRRDEILRR